MHLKTFSKSVGKMRSAKGHTTVIAGLVLISMSQGSKLSSIMKSKPKSYRIMKLITSKTLTVLKLSTLA